MNGFFSFFDVFPDIPRIEVVDLGAMPLEEAKEVYEPLVQSRRARVTGFEPNVDACAEFNQRQGAPHRCLPYFIGDGGPATFHETTAAMSSSLFRPNEAVLALYPNVAPYIRLKASHPVQTKRLDDVAEIDGVDFLKMDIQGGELAALKGARRLLQNVLAVQAEVEFVPLYEGQPLFADVDTFMRAAGFQFHTFTRIARRFVRPIQITNIDVRGINQMLWANAIYIRDLTSLATLEPARQMMLAAVMHELYGSVDVSLHIVDELARRTPGLNVDTYVRRVMLEAPGLS